MDDVKVSILMLAYNHDKYIKQALESVLEQKTNFNYEIVIGEDCSKDNTKAVLLEYAERYPEIIKLVLHDENVGPTRNWYDVIKQCSGKYIANLEGDDYWTDYYKLQKQVDFLEEHSKYIGVAHNYENVDKNGNRISLNIIPESFINSKFTIKDFFKERFVFQSATSMYRNIFKSDDSSSRLVYQASPIVGDLTILTILLDKGDYYILPDYMSAYRHVREDSAENICSRGRTNPLESITLTLNQIAAIEKHFAGKYDLSKIASWYFVTFLGITLKYKFKLIFNIEVYKLYSALSIKVKLMILVRFVKEALMWPIKKGKRS